MRPDGTPPGRFPFRVTTLGLPWKIQRPSFAFGRASDQQRVHDRYPSGDGNSFSHRRERRSVRDVLERPPLVRRYRASLAKRTSSPSGASSAAPALTVCLVMN